MSWPRVLIAGLFHETHTFLEGTTTLGEFAVLRGEEMLGRAGDSSPRGGVLERAQVFQWTTIPAVDFCALPSAIVEDEVFEAYWRELRPCLERNLEAICLVLHGAMVCESIADVEGELLRRIRSVVGPGVLIFGVFDLHANFTGDMAALADGLVGYRENPHTDGRRAGEIAAELLQRSLITRQRPKMAWRHPAIMWPPTGTGTAQEPMASLEAMARRLEARHPEFWAVSVVAGFSFADTPETGVSFVIVHTGEDAMASAALDELCAHAEVHRAEGNATDPAVSEVMAQLRPLPPGLTVLVEPADNIGGGAPGDATGLLRALLEFEIPNAAIAINDPAAVEALGKLRPGDRVVVPIGGRGSRLDAGPVTLEVELIRTSDGRFELEDKNSHLASMSGDFYDMGPCAVVRAGNLTMLLTSRKTPPFDLGQWRSQGIEPTAFSVIAVKAAVAHRRAYDPIATRMLWVNTPGPCTSDLRGLPYVKIRRPIFPLDE